MSNRTLGTLCNARFKALAESERSHGCMYVETVADHVKLSRFPQILSQYGDPTFGTEYAATAGLIRCNVGSVAYKISGSA
jgi:hypothetical protein